MGMGGAGDIGSGQAEQRVDIKCYGVSEIQCMKIWRALDNYLIPRFARRKSGFIRNGCQVNFIVREGGFLSLKDPDAADWPYTWAPYICNYNLEPRT